MLHIHMYTRRRADDKGFNPKFGEVEGILSGVKFEVNNPKISARLLVSLLLNTP